MLLMFSPFHACHATPLRHADISRYTDAADAAYCRDIRYYLLAFFDALLPFSSLMLRDTRFR